MRAAVAIREALRGLACGALLFLRERPEATGAYLAPHLALLRLEPLLRSGNTQPLGCQPPENEETA